MKDIVSQQAEQSKATKKHMPLSFYFKCGAIVSFVLISVLIAACGGDDQGKKGTFGTAVTVTIQAGIDNSSTQQTNKLQCGAWATQQTPNINTTSQIGVYGKFVQRDDNNNPRGVDGADVTATVIWGDLSTETMKGTTTADGLVVFALPLANREGALYKVSLVIMTFNKPGVGQCALDQTKNPASFTLISATPGTTGSATPPGQKTPKPTRTPRRGGANGNGDSTPTDGATASPNSTSTDTLNGGIISDTH